MRAWILGLLLLVVVAAPRTSRADVDVEVVAGGGYADGVARAEGAVGPLVGARVASSAHGAHAFVLADGQYLPGLSFAWGPPQDGWALQSRWLLGMGIATRPGPGPGAYLRVGLGAELLFVRVTGTGFGGTTYSEAADSTGLAGALAVGVTRLALGGQLGVELALGGSVHGGSSDPLLDAGHEAARVDLVAIYRPWARASTVAGPSAPATLHAELGVGAGTQLNLDAFPSFELRVGGRVVRASSTGLEPFAALDVGFVPDVQYYGGDSYSQSALALELRGLAGLGIGSRAPGPAAFVRVGAGASLLHKITETSGDDGFGDSYHETESDTSVAPVLGLAFAVGRARGSGAFLGVELSAAVAPHDDVTASIDLAVVARGR